VSSRIDAYKKKKTATPPQQGEETAGGREVEG